MQILYETPSLFQKPLRRPRRSSAQVSEPSIQHATRQTSSRKEGVCGIHLPYAAEPRCEYRPGTRRLQQRSDSTKARAERMRRRKVQAPFLLPLPLLWPGYDSSKPSAMTRAASGPGNLSSSDDGKDNSRHKAKDIDEFIGRLTITSPQVRNLHIHFLFSACASMKLLRLSATLLLLSSLAATTTIRPGHTDTYTSWRCHCVKSTAIGIVFFFKCWV
jgi:hypothetical protein